MKKYATAKQIRAARQRAGLDQQQAADVVGKDKSNFQRWEYGKVQRIPLLALEALLKLPEKPKEERPRPGRKRAR